MKEEGRRKKEEGLYMWIQGPNQVGVLKRTVRIINRR
jgi:hypothetical protein